MEIEDRWQAIPIEYRDKAYQLFHKIKFDEPYVIEEKVAPENRERFKVIAAYFIRWNEGKAANFTLEFSNDFLRIRKLHIPAPFSVEGATAK